MLAAQADLVTLSGLQVAEADREPLGELEQVQFRVMVELVPMLFLHGLAQRVQATQVIMQAVAAVVRFKQLLGQVKAVQAAVVVVAQIYKLAQLAQRIQEAVAAARDQAEAPHAQVDLEL
jgi:hypothetical protein